MGFIPGTRGEVGLMGGGPYEGFLIGPLLTSGASPMVPIYKQVALLRGNSV